MPDAYQRYGRVLAPSSVDFPFLDYVPEELTNDQILSIIAGYDGVEIHGANYYSLQQFFSVYSNRRDDQWGGSMEKRMAFPLAVLKKVKETAAEKAGKDFIVGYRISPEEVHGENVGYTVDDALHLINAVIENGTDYIHVSSIDYKAMPQKGGAHEPIAKTVYTGVGGRVPVLLAGSIMTPDDALSALEYADIAALGRAVIIDPDFVPKLRDGIESEIKLSVEGRLDKLALPKILLDFWRMENTPLPHLQGLTQ